MEQGKLYYDEKLDRLVLNGYGFHCGDGLEVLLNETWVNTRVEAKSDWSTGTFKPSWYLEGLEGLKIEGLTARK